MKNYINTKTISGLILTFTLGIVACQKKSEDKSPPPAAPAVPAPAAQATTYPACDAVFIADYTALETLRAEHTARQANAATCGYNITSGDLNTKCGDFGLKHTAVTICREQAKTRDLNATDIRNFCNSIRTTTQTISTCAMPKPVAAPNDDDVITDLTSEEAVKYQGKILDVKLFLSLKGGVVAKYYNENSAYGDFKIPFTECSISFERTDRTKEFTTGQVLQFESVDEKTSKVLWGILGSKLITDIKMKDVDGFKDVVVSCAQSNKKGMKLQDLRYALQGIVEFTKQ